MVLQYDCRTLQLSKQVNHLWLALKQFSMAIVKCHRLQSPGLPRPAVLDGQLPTAFWRPTQMCDPNFKRTEQPSWQHLVLSTSQNGGWNNTTLCPNFILAKMLETLAKKHCKVPPKCIPSIFQVVSPDWFPTSYRIIRFATSVSSFDLPNRLWLTKLLL